MPNCSQLTREWCRKCDEDTLHVCARCNHCGTEHRVYKGPAFEHSRVYKTQRPAGKKMANPSSAHNAPSDSNDGCFINGGRNLAFGGVSDDMYQG